ncbi:hypothetical protein CBL_13977 [Carabus blaptoides fortunei]
MLVAVGRCRAVSTETPYSVCRVGYVHGSVQSHWMTKGIHTIYEVPAMCRSFPPDKSIRSRTVSLNSTVDSVAPTRPLSTDCLVGDVFDTLRKKLLLRSNDVSQAETFHA